MTSEQKKNNNAKSIINNIEHILPEIEKKLSGREKAHEEYAYIKTRVPELKKELMNAEDNYINLLRELNEINKNSLKLYLQMEPSRFVRLYNKIKQMWKISKTYCSIMFILIVVLVINLISAFYRNNTLQTLSLESGFTIIIIIIWFTLPKYRQLTGLSILAMGLLIYTNFVIDASFKWTLISIGIALIGIGLAMQSFNSDIVVERKLDKIDSIEKKMDLILAKYSKSPDTKDFLTQLIDPKEKSDNEQ
jgi:hypothetical protein